MISFQFYLNKSRWGWFLSKISQKRKLHQTTPYIMDMKLKNNQKDKNEEETKTPCKDEQKN